MGRAKLATAVVTVASCAVAAGCGDGPTATHSLASSPSNAVAAAAATTAVSVQGSTTSSSTVYGVHLDIGLQPTEWIREQMLSRAKNIHAHIIRTGLKWGDIEGREGSRNWSAMDGAVSELQSAGIQILATVWGSPSWANGSSDFVYVPTNSSQFNTWVSRYASFAGAAAARYKGRIKYYELWNEENITDWWHPHPNVDLYVAWFKAVSAAIHSADPGAIIGMGGVTNLLYAAPGDPSGKLFITEMYQRGVFPEAVVIHPYAPKNQYPTQTLQWQNNFTDIGVIHSLMEQWGQGGKQLWLTEWGWRSDQIGETNQANYTAEALTMIATWYPYVTLSTYFLQDDQSGYAQGLYTTSTSLKPAGQRFQSFAASHY